MKKILLLTVYILFCINSQLMALEISEIFEEHLPKRVVNDKTMMKLVSSQLESKARIHPRLLYFYIERLNSLYGTDSTDNQYYSVLNTYIPFIEKKLSLQRSKWASNEIQEISKSTIDKKETLIFKLEKLIRHSEISKSEEIPNFIIDVNKLNYYILKYYKKEKDLEYNQNIMYKDLVQDYKVFYINLLLDTYKAAIKNVNIRDLAIIDELINKWHVFTDVPLDSSIYFKPNLLMLQLQRNSNTPIKYPHFSMNFGTFFLNNYFELNEEFRVQDMVNYCTYETSISSFNMYGVTLNYLLYLRKQQSIFQYIKFSSSILYQNFNTKENFDTGFSERFFEEGVEYWESMVFESDAFLKMKDSYSYLFTLSTPLFFFTKDVAIEAAIFGGLQYLNYEVDYTFTYVKYREPYWWLMFRGDLLNVNYKKTEKEYFIAPAMILSFRLLKRLNLTYTLSTDNQFFNLGFYIF